MAHRKIGDVGKRENTGARKIAICAGEKHYLTGLPCTSGHVAERQTSNGGCVICLKIYAKINAQALRDNVRRCELKDIPKKNARIRAWATVNPHKRSANEARRRAAKLRRTPKWLTPDDFWLMEQAYELAALRTKMFGFAWHVDHVIPLQGKRVSGLHVPQNIQVIPGEENLQKHNRHEVA